MQHDELGFLKEPRGFKRRTLPGSLHPHPIKAKFPTEMKSKNAKNTGDFFAA